MMGRRRDRIAVICGRPKRDKLDLAKRWLVRFTEGPWHVGGHHVGRLNFGPALCEDPKKPNRGLYIARHRLQPQLKRKAVLAAPSGAAFSAVV